MQHPSTAHILPCDKGVQILYNGEICTVENFSVQEFVEALKLLYEQQPLLENFKEAIEQVANHQNLPQKPTTT